MFHSQGRASERFYQGSKQALSLGLMAQKKLQDAQFFGDNGAFSSFSKDQQEQLLRDLRAIELARNVLIILASDSKAEGGGGLISAVISG